jgi:hypothetical protein
VIPGYSFTRVRSTTTKCTRGCGCNGHPAFPTPSLGGRFINASGALRREVANARRMSSDRRARGCGCSNTELGGGYGNNEEFYANTIEMIYRSEKRLPIYDYAYNSFDPASFLERNMASVLLTDLRVAQQSLFDALAKVNADFNPIKQLDEQRRKLLGG